MTADTLLRVDGVTKRFGGLTALAGVTMTVRRGEILGLIGPNGAGKTTLFHVITGVLRPDQGSVRFLDRDLARVPGHQRCRLGLARTYQSVRPFLEISVRENVVIGARFGAAGRVGAGELRDRVDEALHFVGLSQKAAAEPRHLTLVDRKMVELARALATQPKLLLLDEVLSGLNPSEMAGATKLIRRMRDERSITVVWVEHVMRALMATCERAIVLNFGSVLADGTPAEVIANPDVVRAYLGEKRQKHDAA